MTIYALVYGNGKDRYKGRLWQGHDIPERAMHVCDTPIEAVILWALHHAGIPCPRCGGSMVMLHGATEVDRRAIAAVANKWLHDPSNDVERTRGSLFWQEMNWLYDTALTAANQLDAPALG